MIDASALLAFLQDEAGAERVEQALLAGRCHLSAVNRVEVVGKLVGMGALTAAQVETHLEALGSALQVEAFSEAQARAAAFFYARRHPYRLSLGDCACLALGELRGEPVLTAERGWAGIEGLRVGVELVR